MERTVIAFLFQVLNLKLKTYLTMFGIYSQSEKFINFNDSFEILIKIMDSYICNNQKVKDDIQNLFSLEIKYPKFEYISISKLIKLKFVKIDKSFFMQIHSYNNKTGDYDFKKQENISGIIDFLTVLYNVKDYFDYTDDELEFIIKYKNKDYDSILSTAHKIENLFF